MARKKAISTGKKGDGYIFRRPGGSSYYLEYTVDGCRKKVSLRTNSKTEAERRATEYLSPVRAKTAAEVALHVAQARKVVSQKDILLDDAFAEFERASRCGSATLRAYRSAWGIFLGWLQREHSDVKTMGQIDRQIALSYGEELAGRDMSNRTFNHHRSSLSIITRKLLLKMGSDSSDPWQFVDAKSRDTVSKQELTQEDVLKLLNKLADPSYGISHREEWQVVFHLGIFAGLRLADCILMEWGFVDLQTGELSLIPKKTARHLRRVSLPIHPNLREQLSLAVAWRQDDSPYLCPNLAARYQYNPSGIQKDAVRVFEDCKFTTHKELAGRAQAVSVIGFHSLRHSFVSFCANAGVPLSTVQALVGHGSPAMTRHYTHVSKEAAQKAISALPELVKNGHRAKATDAELLAEVERVLKRIRKPSPIERRLLKLVTTRQLPSASRRS